MNKIKLFILTVLIAILCAAMVGLVACGSGGKGETGDTGAAGAQGAAGEDGTDGQDGKTAYEVYLEYYPDYSGDEAQWYEDLAAGNLATITFTVTFRYNNGTTEDLVKTVTLGHSVEKPEDPAYTGYTFAGWYCGDEKWSFDSYTVTGNITLDASWTITNGELVFSIVTASDSTQTYTITGYTGSESVIEIPTQFNGIQITGIGESAFRENTHIRHVEIPDTITYIEEKAFYGCSNLTSVTIPDSITTIAFQAFLNCTSLSSVYYGGTADDWVSITLGGTYANPTYHGAALYFADSSAEEGYTLAEDIVLTTTSIGNWAFYNCSSIVSVTIAENTTEIPSAFSRCISLKSVTIPASVKTIGNNAFSDCTNLSSVYYGGTADGYASISFTGEFSVPTCYGAELYFADDTASGGYSLAEELVLTVDISQYAFYNCPTIKSITIGEDVTSIGNMAFYNTTNLTTINYNAKSLNDSVAANYIFYKSGTDGDGIKVTLGANVTKLPDYIFHSATNGTNPKITEVDTSAATQLKSIGAYVFYNATYLTSINIPESVTTIGSNAFHGAAITSITIPANVTSIGTQAFRVCESLETITFKGAGKLSIGSVAFFGCTALKEVHYAGSATSWATNITFGNQSANPFYSASSASLYTTDSGNTPLTVVSIAGTGTTSINSYAFYNYQTITRVYISFVQTIGTEAFYNCGGIESVTINGVQTIGDKAFYKCTGMTSLDFQGTTLEKIGGSAFYECSSLTSLVIPDSVQTISDSAFIRCFKLEEITIGSGVTFIGAKAFMALYVLTTINYNATAVTNELAEDTYVFYQNIYNGSGATLNIGGNVTKIPDNLFYNCSYIKEINYNAEAAEDLTADSNVFYNVGNKYGLTVNIGSTVTSIPAYLFYNNTYINGVTIESGVQTIGAHAFHGCTSIPSVTLPGSVQTIGTSAFQACTSIASITIPASVTAINSAAFYDSKALTAVYYAGTADQWASITFGSGSSSPLFYGASLYLNGDTTTAASVITLTVTTVNENAFYGCTSITDVTFADTVTAIGNGAFRNNTALTRVTLGSGVASIGTNSFNGCTISTIYVEKGSSLTLTAGGTDNGYIASNSEVTIYADTIIQGEYKFYYNSYYYLIDYTGSSTEITTPTFTLDGTTTNYRIDSAAFSGSDIVSLNVSGTAIWIHGYAFADCTSLTTVVLGSQVTQIANYAFNNCTALTNLTITGYTGTSSLSVATNSFDGCTALSTIVLLGEGDGKVSILGNPFPDSTITTVYFGGTADEYTDKVSDSNGVLSGATIYYYSASQPTTTGNYWHYENGVITVW